MTELHTPADSIAISSARLNDNMAALGQIGLTDEGMQRVAFSAFDIAGRDHVMGLMAAAGMSVRIDAAGNIIGRSKAATGRVPPSCWGRTPTPCRAEASMTVRWA